MPLHDWTRVDANLYHHFHGRWVYAVADRLNAGLLPDGYLALAEQSTPPVIPDVVTLEMRDPAPAAGEAVVALPRVGFTLTGRGRAAVRTRRLAVRHAAGRRLVAVVEIVSPANRRDRRELTRFVDNVCGLLRSGVHVMILDPLPPGRRDRHGMHAAVWRDLVGGRFVPPVGKPMTLAAYAARGGDEFSAFVEPVAVGDTLADMPLFLTPESHTNVPVEATYRDAWATFPAALRRVVEGLDDTAG